jgi:hypothetical protein
MADQMPLLAELDKGKTVSCDALHLAIGTGLSNAPAMQRGGVAILPLGGRR